MLENLTYNLGEEEQIAFVLNEFRLVVEWAGSSCDGITFYVYRIAR